MNKLKIKDKRKASRLFIFASLLVLVAVFFISLALGKFPFSIQDGASMIISKFVPMDHYWTDQQETLFFNVRLPRILLALFVGCCLSAAGCAFQATFQNPLVSPDILGASQGAGFGAALAILLGLSSFFTTSFAFVFSIITVFLVVLIGKRSRGNKILIIVLSGIMMSTLMSAAISYVKLVADQTNQLPAITYWLMGSFANTTMDEIVFVLPFMAVGLAVLFIMRWRINVLTVGDDQATAMGIDAPKNRLIVIIAATLVTASSVAVSGIIGWVGLIVPHLCRMVIGADNKMLMPSSMIVGAVFMLVVDNFARLCGTVEIPIGILTAFIGTPFFLYLILRRKRIER